jgi:tripartite-type tricarboxylate transporter receptor subunit TctC
VLAVVQRFFLALCGCLALCNSASANDYSSRAIRMILGLAPGGGGDAFARVLSEELRKSFGIPVFVENRPGGNETIGARACAEAEPDGLHRLLLVE